ncbi:cupin domain-containing protein [Amycolatopsis sp. NBRC 101858]|uniref:cupin domain-containing protein n=1 Tax=Amycolatopsis sp. NBRC 101858 TaxID=3032200 RepID=UPI003338BB4D
MPFDELLYVIHGQATVTVEGVGTVRLEPGDVCYLTQGQTSTSTCPRIFTTSPSSCPTKRSFIDLSPEAVRSGPPAPVSSRPAHGDSSRRFRA